MKYRIRKDSKNRYWISYTHNGRKMKTGPYTSRARAEWDADEWEWLDNETDSRVLQAMGAI